MSGVAHVEVSVAEDGMRLDRWFKSRFPALTQGQLQKMLRKGEIRVEGGRVQANRRVEAGETVRVPPLPDAAPRKAEKQGPSEADARDIRSYVLYEDKDLYAINKPFGLPVQGGSKVTRHLDGMLDALAKKGEERPRLVHRLDKDTGGLMLLAKTRASAKRLTEAFKRHEIEKTYWALSAGVPHPMAGLIDMPVEKTGEEGREKMSGGAGKKALTDYQVVDVAAGKAAFVALRPHTGRTHQIRVHLSEIGTPIVGDGKYGGERAKLEGVSPKMHLFCRGMTVPRPNGPPLRLEAPLTGHMKKTWAFFGFETSPELEWPER